MNAYNLAIALSVMGHKESEDENDRRDKLPAGRVRANDDDTSFDRCGTRKCSGHRNGGVSSILPAANVEQ